MRGKRFLPILFLGPLGPKKLLTNSSQTFSFCVIARITDRPKKHPRIHILLPSHGLGPLLHRRLNLAIEFLVGFDPAVIP